MSGVRRFLSRREKSPRADRHERHDKEKEQSLAKHTPHHQPKQPPHFAGIFTDRPRSSRLDSAEHSKNVKGIHERLRHYGVDNITEQNIEYALHHATPQGDPEAAFKLLALLEDTYSGIVRPYDPASRLVGAVNKEGVTCYLDALLFGMFIRLGNFEAMLYDSYPNPKQKRLGALLRLWVNMLRSGRLITTDITAQLQLALAECGWEGAAENEQQDPSEAFTFITDQLQLPMLTLKMDMFHTGKEDPQDDHKFVNERLLEVAILDAPIEGRSVITLEDCLEHYFNNRIEVKRHMENQRRNTLKSGQAPPYFEEFGKAEKEPGTHIEVAEVPETPLAATPVVATPVHENPKTPIDRLRPTFGRKRQDSIFSQRKVQIIDGVELENALTKTDSQTSHQELPGRKLSTRTEVLMPAWQFFKLLPWYTENTPTSDAQVAAHFAQQRPILGICLKRYSYTNDGQARKRDDFVDIPLEIAVPEFVSGDEMDGAESHDGHIGGNFRLLLQSVICHRGVSVHSGHYVCLSRSQPANASRRGSAESDDSDEDPWIRFDDLARERIQSIDIHEALKQESPYLLFYQVQPIGDEAPEHELPSYFEATSRSQSDAAPLEKPYLREPSPPSDSALTDTIPDIAPPSRAATDSVDWAPSTRNSLDIPLAAELRRGRSGASTFPESDGRRNSVAVESSTDTGSIRTDPASNSVPSTPLEEKPNSSLLNISKVWTNSRKNSRNSASTSTSTSAKPADGTIKPNRSRPSSTERPMRLSLNMTKLTQRMSKGQSAVVVGGTEDDVPIILPSDAVAAELAGQKPVGGEGDGHGQVRDPASQPPQTGPLSKKEKKRLKQQGKGEEERECSVM